MPTLIGRGDDMRGAAVASRGAACDSGAPNPLPPSPTATPSTSAPSRYVYLGDRLTDPGLVGQPCAPIRRADGKCLVGRSPRNQAVRFEDGREVVVLARRLRLIVTPITLTRSVLLRSQPITAGDSTSDKEARDVTAPGKPGQASPERSVIAGPRGGGSDSSERQGAVPRATSTSARKDESRQRA